jgi:oxygen-independent coproporphyrinogen-3 oxidase
MCHFETDVADLMRYELQWTMIKNKLNPLIKDGLAAINGTTVYILEAGRPFVRNICMAFDYRISDSSSMTNMFSSTV